MLNKNSLSTNVKCILYCYMAKPVLGKSQRPGWFFLGRDFAVWTVFKPCSFVSEQSQQIHNLKQLFETKTAKKLRILSFFTRNQEKAKMVDFIADFKDG